MTDQWQKAREAAVRAICATEKAEHGCACDPNVETPYGSGVRGCWLLADEKLVAALSAFSAAGYEVVPKVPSDAMVDAAWLKTRTSAPADIQALRAMPNQMAFEYKMRHRYAAMIAAAMKERQT